MALLCNDPYGAILFIADCTWEIITAGEKPLIYNSHCSTLSIWDHFRCITLSWNKLHFCFDNSIPTQRCFDCDFVLLSAYLLGWTASTPATSQRPLSTHRTPNVCWKPRRSYIYNMLWHQQHFPHLLRIYLLGTDEGCFSLERVEMACGHVVVVLLSV